MLHAQAYELARTRELAPPLFCSPGRAERCCYCGGARALSLRSRFQGTMSMVEWE